MTTMSQKTAVVLVVFGLEPYRLLMLRTVIQYLRRQSTTAFIAVGILNWPDGQPFPRWFNEINQIIKARGNRKLFQKEALFNYVETFLPTGITSIVFLDADIVCEDSDWLKTIGVLLERYEIVQGFCQVYYLSKFITATLLRGTLGGTLLSAIHSHPLVDASSCDPALTSDDEDTVMAHCIVSTLDALKPNGNPGICWAARRESFRRVGRFPWYDIFSGANDLFWVYLLTQKPRHRFFGELEAFGLKHGLLDPKIRPIASSFCNIPVFHLWHKCLGDRNYLGRQTHLRHYVPCEDVRLGEWGGLELTERGRRFDSILRELEEQIMSVTPALTDLELSAICQSI